MQSYKTTFTIKMKNPYKRWGFYTKRWTNGSNIYGRCVCKVNLYEAICETILKNSKHYIYIGFKKSNIAICFAYRNKE